MSVKAVFYVQEVTDTASGAGRVKMIPSAKGPYAEYSQYTPTGSIEFTSLNPAATEFFRAMLSKARAGEGGDVSVVFDEAGEDDLITPPFNG